MQGFINIKCQSTILMLSSKKKPDAYIDVHSYGQLIMYPWSSKSKPPKERNHLYEIGVMMSKAIKATTGKKYSVGDVYNTIYQCTGTQIDWWYSLGVGQVYTFEMRDTLEDTINRKGFLVSPKYIEPTGRDLSAAIYRLAEELAVKKANKNTEKFNLRTILNYTTTLNYTTILNYTIKIISEIVGK